MRVIITVDCPHAREKTLDNIDWALDQLHKRLGNASIVYDVEGEDPDPDDDHKLMTGVLVRLKKCEDPNVPGEMLDEEVAELLEDYRGQDVLMVRVATNYRLDKADDGLREITPNQIKEVL